MSGFEDILRVRREARLVYSAREVEAALAAMGRAVAARVAERNPMVLAVMQGGAFTAVHLCAHFDFPYEFDHVHLSRYGDRVAGGELEWQTHPNQALTGRSVLLVDDVLDRGVALAALHEAIAALQPAEIFVAVLVSKRLAEPVARPEPDFVALETDDVYLFGCGMDYKGYWRGLPALYAVASS